MEPIQVNGSTEGIEKVCSTINQVLSEIKQVHEFAVLCVSFSTACLQTIQSKANPKPDSNAEELMHAYLEKVEKILEDFGNQVEATLTTTVSKREEK